MTDKIATNLKVKMSELSLVPYADGRFEIFVDDEKVYSKLETKEFPDEEELVQKLKQRVGL